MRHLGNPPFYKRPIPQDRGAAMGVRSGCGSPSSNAVIDRRIEAIPCHGAITFSPRLLVNRTHKTRSKGSTGGVLTIKNVVIPLEVEYLQKAAKERGVSRTKLVRVMMQKIVRDELVPKILGDDHLVHTEPPQQRYRRFRNSN
jgi:hypothetical protein